MLTRSMLVAAAAALLAAPVSQAATPESGKISRSAPAVKWTGQAPGYGFNNVNFVFDGPTMPCEPEYCDTFTLETADVGDLTIKAEDGSGFIDVVVRKPDGSTLWSTGEEDAPTTFKIVAAPVGTYVIEVTGNAPMVVDAGDYQGSATLAFGDVTEPVVPATPGAAPAPGAGPSAALALRTRSAKAGRSLKLGVSTSAPVRDLVARVFKGKKVVATGKLARLSGTGRVTVKARNVLKAGAYTVALSARDAGGRKVGATGKLRLRK